MNEDILFDADKFKAVAHYIIASCDGIESDVLNGLLYFADFNYYEINEASLTGEKYVRKPQGPVPVHLSKAIDELECEGKIRIGSSMYSSVLEPDASLPDDEEDVIGKAIARMNGLKDIGEYCRGDLPFRIAKADGQLNYEAVFYREDEYSVRQYQ